MCYRAHFLYICLKNFLPGIDIFTTERLFLYYVFEEKRLNMATTSKIDEAKELIKAGLKRELILKITSISEYEYSLLQRELLATA